MFDIFPTSHQAGLDKKSFYCGACGGMQSQKMLDPYIIPHFWELLGPSDELSPAKQLLPEGKISRDQVFSTIIPT